MRSRTTLRRAAPGWLLLSLLPACDRNGPNEGPRATVAVLSAIATFNQPALGRQHFCTLSGNWSLPAWPDAADTSTAALTLTRELRATGPGNLRRDTLLPDVRVTWLRVDSTHLNLGLGPPISITFSGTLDSAAGRTWRGVWPCPASLPFGADSGLLASGYEPDSLEPGVLTIARVSPVD